MRTYLDYNATSPLLPSVRQGMVEHMAGAANPSSMHQEGQRARQTLTRARHQIAEFIDADPEHIIFTSGGTEANNLVLKGINWDQVLMSAVEHESVWKAWSKPILVPVDEKGIIDHQTLENTLKKVEGQTCLVSIIWANNETGVIQPLAEIVALAHRYGVLVHTDAVQMMGRLPFSFKKIGVDFMTISAHKFGGPQGVGALIAKDAIPLTAMMSGGGQEKGRRSGTENVAAIVGFGLAVEAAPSLGHLPQLHQTLEAHIKTVSQNQAIILGDHSDRLPNTTCVIMPGVENAIQVMRFDLEGVAVSAGSACSSGRVKTASRIVEAVTHNYEHALSAIRMSSGWASTKEDFLKAQNVWEKIYKTVSRS